MKTIKRLGGLIHQSTDNFRVVEKRGRFYVECLRDNHTPQVKRIKRKDVDYLQSAGKSFDAACVLDFGCGAFRGRPSAQLQHRHD